MKNALEFKCSEILIEKNANIKCMIKKIYCKNRKKYIYPMKIETTHHFQCNKKFRGIVRL